MGLFVKVMAAMLLTLPLGAYIAGTLVASQTDMPDQRPAVVIDGSPSETSPTTQKTSGPSPTEGPSARGDDDDDDDRGRGRGRGGDDDDDGPRVVRPTPRDLDDDYLEDLAEEREEHAEERRELREDLHDDSDDDHDDRGDGGDDGD